MRHATLRVNHVSEVPPWDRRRGLMQCRLSVAFFFPLITPFFFSPLHCSDDTMVEIPFVQSESFGAGVDGRVRRDLSPFSLPFVTLPSTSWASLPGVYSLPQCRTEYANALEE